MHILSPINLPATLAVFPTHVCKLFFVHYLILPTIYDRKITLLLSQTRFNDLGPFSIFPNSLILNRLSGITYPLAWWR